MIKLWLKESVKSYETMGDAQKIIEEMSMLKNADQETVWLIGLNNANKVLIKECVFKGSIDQSIACPKLIFKRLLAVGASSFVIIHNHPSGDCKPSKNDDDVTKRMAKIAGFLDIQMFDHIIIADKFYSYASETTLITEGTKRGKTI